MTTTPHNIITSPSHDDAYADAWPHEDAPDAGDTPAGYRLVCHEGDGAEWEEWVPLTLDDLLHPQLGDEVIYQDLHHAICGYLYTMFTDLLAHDPTAVVLFDVGLDLNLPAIPAVGPDIQVSFGVRERGNWSTFSVREEGVCPALVVEVTSPRTRYNDINLRNPAKARKYRWYAQAGVALYLVVDLARRKDGHPPPLYGFQLTPEGSYAPFPPNDQGWLWLDPVGVWVGPKGDRVTLYDAQGHELESRSAAIDRADAERTRADAAEDKAQAFQDRADAAEDKAQAFQDRADAERTRADAAEERARRLEEQLRNLGIAPETNDE
jgi:hypothetical protein